MNLTRYSDADRIRLATFRKGRFYGPVETQACARHPDQEVAFRWSWAESIEDSDCEVVRGCAVCAREEEDSDG